MSDIDLTVMQRLHYLCDALSEQADQSPFTREEWDRVDKQVAHLNTELRIARERIAVLENALRIAYDAVRHPIDDWKGVVERQACEAIRAALSSAAQPPKAGRE